MLIIDGAMGEGGGQVLRSALSLSVCRRRPIRVVNIRAGRKRPGLRAQHLAAVAAAAEICGARVEGLEVGSPEIRFAPGAVRPGAYRFDIGTAGSTSLVLQTVLPPLLTAAAPSQLRLEGGTHNPWAPTFDFLEGAFLPIIARMGAGVEALLERPGFYPAGGGRVRARIGPARRLRPLDLRERGKLLEIRARALVARLPEEIAHRELGVVAQALGLGPESLELRSDPSARSPGNALTVVVRSGAITEVFTGLGKRGLRAERVAGEVVEAVERYLAAGVPVGAHLADQIVLPLAIAGSGSFRTLRPSRHLRTNVDLLRQISGREIGLAELGEDVWEVEIGGGRR